MDGKDYYSTKNSDIVTVEVEGGPLSFEQGGAITCTYGDEPFTNAASMDGSTEGFAYSSSDETVAKVDANTGKVTIVGAGSAVITAEKDGVTEWEGQPAFSGSGTYRAQEGESLWDYANRWGLSIEALVESNPHIPNINELEAGEKVVVP